MEEGNCTDICNAFFSVAVVGEGEHGLNWCEHVAHRLPSILEQSSVEDVGIVVRGAAALVRKDCVAGRTLADGVFECVREHHLTRVVQHGTAGEIAMTLACFVDAGFKDVALCEMVGAMGARIVLDEKDRGVNVALVARSLRKVGYR